MADNVLWATERYACGKLRYIHYGINGGDAVGESMGELVELIKRNVRPDDIYVNTDKSTSIVIVDPSASEVAIDRPLTTSELELFAKELSNSLFLKS